MSQYKTKREGEELVMQALPDASWSHNNDHDIDWRGIKIAIRVRGKTGKIGDIAFSFSSRFTNPEPVYVLVGIDEDGSYFWVIPGKEMVKKSSFYASMKEAVPYPELKQAIVDKAIA